MTEAIEDIRQRILKDLPATHPTTARYPAIAEPLSYTLAYREWRRHRAYDHCDVVPGAKMPDGQMGYAISFCEDEKISSVFTIRLSRDEMQELRDKIDKELGNGQTT